VIGGEPATTGHERPPSPAVPESVAELGRSKGRFLGVVDFRVGFGGLFSKRRPRCGQADALSTRNPSSRWWLWRNSLRGSCAICAS